MKINSKQYLMLCSVGALLLLCVCAGIGSNLSGSVTTPKQVAHVATKVPTAKPTATLKPKPLTDLQKLQQMVNTISYGQGAVTYDTDLQEVEVSYHIQPQFTDAQNQQVIEEVTFRFEKAIWTQWVGSKPIILVSVAIYGIDARY